MNFWYTKSILGIFLLPISWCFRFVICLRRYLYKIRFFETYQAAVPVIVVGNVTVGGTGKTPLTIAIAKHLSHTGFKPGIVSRGYGGAYTTEYCDVTPESDPKLIGDEPVLIAKQTQCPLVVAKNRVTAAKVLLEKYQVNIILCDDGLQHYALGRDIEIAVVDAKREFGNGFCLPAGPLREPISRLRQTDFVVLNGGNSADTYEMTLMPGFLTNLHDETITRDIEDFNREPIHAVAAIGNPDRFFNLLGEQGFHVIGHPFPDHYQFKQEDISFNDNYPVFMTEKDAVKCKSFATFEHWYLPVEARLDKAFFKELTDVIARRR